MNTTSTTSAAPASPARDANDKFTQRIEDLVLGKIAQDTLVVPLMPAVALRCLEVLRRPEFSFKEAAVILEQDPVLAAKVLRTANSVAFAGVTKSHSLSDALARIGAKTAKAILVGASAAQVFTSRNPEIAAYARGLWQHSVAVGLLARDVHALTGGSESDAAYLAGLLHDIGKPLVAAVLLEAERQIVELRSAAWIGSAAWWAVVKRTHRKVALALADKWALPGEVAQTVAECGEYDPTNRMSIANAVCLANALAKVATIGTPDADLDDAKALVMIGRSMLGLDDAVLTPLVDGLKTKVEHIYS